MDTKADGGRGGGGGGGAEHCFDMFRFESLEGTQSSYEHGVGP